MTQPVHVMDRLVESCRKHSSLACVGLDPHLASLPACLQSEGSKVKQARRFLSEILRALRGIVPAVKPQIAFFEQLGWEGVRLYFDMIVLAHELGYMVIGDIKRADIGSTANAYAAGHLSADDGSAADLVTLNPYLGSDAIRPFLAVGRPKGRGVFVLARTSNPSGSEFQDLEVRGGKLFEAVARRIAEWGQENVGSSGYGDVGAVVGATGPDEGAQLRSAFPGTYFLVPGYGAQGGTAADVVRTLGPCRDGALISSSREILFAYRDSARGDLAFAEAARDAALRMNQDLARAMA